MHQSLTLIAGGSGGGHHASPQHEVILRHHAYVDFVVRGEGEYPLLRLIRGDRVETIPSISFRASGGLIANVPGQLLTTEELDSLGVEFKGQIFESAPGKFNRATYVSARGCPLRCAFCAVAGETIRSKSIGKVIEDLFQLVFVRGYPRIAIEDNFFAQKKSRTLPLCDEIQGFRQNLASNVLFIRAVQLMQQTVTGDFNPEMLTLGHAIIHDKIVVVDPLSTDCTVITGSHNLGYKASYVNDENLLVIKGNQRLAQA